METFSATFALRYTIGAFVSFVVGVFCLAFSDIFKEKRMLNVASFFNYVALVQFMIVTFIGAILVRGFALYLFY